MNNLQIRHWELRNVEGNDACAGLESHGGLENVKVVNDRPIPAVVGGHILIRACPRLGMSGSAVLGPGLTP
jgi:hypothetical protein